LNPAQCLGPAAAIVGREKNVPDPQRSNRANSVNDEKATHGVSAQLFL
jgi:hypothetical protein